MRLLAPCRAKQWHSFGLPCEVGWVWKLGDVVKACGKCVASTGFVLGKTLLLLFQQIWGISNWLD